MFVAEVPPPIPGDIAQYPLPGSRRFVADSDHLLRAGRPEQALELCRAGVQAYPDYAPGWMMMARALWGVGDVEEARHWLHKILEVSPGHTFATFGLESGLTPLTPITPPSSSLTPKVTAPALTPIPSAATRRVEKTPAALVVSAPPPPPKVEDPLPGGDPAPWLTPTEDDDEEDATLTGPGLVSETLADLYLAQGSPREALEMYQALENRGQGSPRLTEKIRRLQEKSTPVDPRIPRLERWLTTITREEGPP